MQSYKEYRVRCNSGLIMSSSSVDPKLNCKTCADSVFMALQQQGIDLSFVKVGPARWFKKTFM